MNLCVIPARGGSKRIPKKNIINFSNKPMIYWSIKAALESECFEKIIVSTDNQEIALIAKSYGAEVPFLRPKELANDMTPTQPVIKHAIEWLGNEGFKYKNACCIYATAPLLRSSDISKSFIKLSKSNKESFIFSATSFNYPIQRAIRIDKDGFASMLFPENLNKRSQDLEETFHDAGQFYWASTEKWMSNSNIFESSKPFLLPRWRVQDIDTVEDLRYAELLFKILR
tara:strand:+ start:13178 stop:13861 length:684 start_codon:yes stop_codon:yes gene_type:complete